MRIVAIRTTIALIWRKIDCIIANFLYKISTYLLIISRNHRRHFVLLLWSIRVGKIAISSFAFISILAYLWFLSRLKLLILWLLNFCLTVWILHLLLWLLSHLILNAVFMCKITHTSFFTVSLLKIKARLKIHLHLQLF